MHNHTFAGTVQSGGTSSALPLEGVPVTLYRATDSEPISAGSTKTGKDGAFSVPIHDPDADTVFYATAAVSRHVLLMTIIGPRVRGPIVINELTTVAAAFSTARFSDGRRIAGNAFGLRIAAMMNDNLVDPHTGEPSPVLLAPPNADQTNTLRSTRSLANLVAACARGTHGIEARFLELATPPGGERPRDTFHALLNIARNPANNAGALFNQSQGVPSVYARPLFSAPDAWTLAVKVNDSGDDNSLFGGPANVAFDRNGYAWIPNNVVQGTPNSGTFIMVLRPDGRPADGRDGTPASPVFGGGLKGPGWGVTIAPNGHAWVGNFGWGDPDTQYPRHGTVSEFRPDGTPVSPEHGYRGGGLDRAQATVADADGNIWMASFGSGDVVVFPHGDPARAQASPSGTCAFGIAIDQDGAVWVSNAGGLGWPQNPEGSVHRFRMEEGRLTALWKKALPVGKACKVIATDSRGHAWLASGGDSTVYRLSPDREVVGAYTGVGGLDAPWGIAVDGDDDVWVANFGAMGLESDYTTGALSHLAGESEKNRRAGLRPGDPISPPTGYTLPSAGEPVLLHNGEPVYKDGTECYTPLMRSTSCQIDQAGNVWVVNNWKPRFRTDFPTDTGNPGGDGIVIFVGLAAPPAWPWASGS